MDVDLLDPGGKGSNKEKRKGGRKDRKREGREGGKESLVGY